MRDIKQAYLDNKQILAILSDTDHPLHEKYCDAVTIEMAQDMRNFVNYCEDSGVQLIAKEAN